MALMSWIVQNTLSACCLALLVAAACRWGKLSPAIRHGLWLVVLLKLITPPLVNVPLPLPHWLTDSFRLSIVESHIGEAPAGEPDTGRVADEVLPMVVSESPIFASETQPTDVPLAIEEPLEFPAADAPAESFAAEPVAAERVGSNPGDEVLYGELAESHHADLPAANVSLADQSWWRHLSPALCLMCVWWIGTALYLAIQVMRLVNLQRMIARSPGASSELVALVNHLSHELNVPPPRVRVVPRLATPALCALGPVSLLWPERARASFSAAGESAVILHELAHLKRRDHWIGWLELLAGCGWWWNPLFWYIRHQMHENAELACDAWVVARLPGGRRAYAEALIDAAQGEPALHLSLVVLGVRDGSRKLLERRLVMIMRGGVRYQIPAVGLAMIVLVAVAALPRWSVANYPESAPVDAELAGVDMSQSAIDAEVSPEGTFAQEAGSGGTFHFTESDTILVESAPEWTAAEPATEFIIGTEFEASEVSGGGILVITGSDADRGADSPATALPNGDQPVTSDDGAEQRTPSAPASPDSQRKNKEQEVPARVRRLEKQIDSLADEIRAIRRNARTASAPALRHRDYQLLETGIKKLDSALRSLRGNPQPAAGATSAGSTDPFQKVVQYKAVPTVEYKAVPTVVSTQAVEPSPVVTEIAIPQFAAPTHGTPVRSSVRRTLRDGALVFEADYTPRQENSSLIETVAMTRTTYKLPPGRAASLAQSLKDKLDDNVEIKVKGDSLQVTASNEDQQAVDHLIHLSQRKWQKRGNPAKADDLQERPEGSHRR